MLLDQIFWIAHEVYDMAFEWPKSAVGWKNMRIVELRDRYLYSTVDFNGCCFGLGGEGALQCKPWRVVSNCQELEEPLGRKRSHDHQHVPTCGVRAKQSELYTDEFVEVVGRTILKLQEMKNER